MKKFVFSNEGFTLLESLTALFICGFISIIMLNMMLVMTSHDDDYKRNIQESLFITQIYRDINTSIKFDIKNGNLELITHEKNVISYEVNDQKITRMVNGKGGQSVMNEFKSAIFINENGMIKVKIDYGKDASENIIAKIIY